MRREARCCLRGRLGEASNPGPPRLRIAGVVASPGEVTSTVPASVGALEARGRGYVAIDSDTESVGSAGRRSHDSLEDALEMNLEPVGEVGPEVDGVMCCQWPR